MDFPVLLLCFLIGCVAGLRSMLAPAIVAAAGYLGWVHLHGTSLGWMSSKGALAFWALAAIGELIYDKLPMARSRIEPMGLAARAITGGLSAWALALGSPIGVGTGIVLGVLGGLVGAYVGYTVRRGLVLQIGLPDLVVAVVEDLLAISGGLYVCSRM